MIDISGKAEVRRAWAEDAPRLAEIYAYYVENTAVSFEYEAPSPAEFRERMRRTMERYPCFVAEVSGHILGYAYAGPFVGRAAYSWACETTVYIDRDARGRGLGRKLYAVLENELQSMGILDMYACIATAAQPDEYLTDGSERFHERMGFSKTGEFLKCGYKFGRWYNMIWMGKTIGEHRQNQPPVQWRRPWHGEGE